MNRKEYLAGALVYVPTKTLYNILEKVSKDKVLWPTWLARELELSKTIVINIVNANFEWKEYVKIRSWTVDHLRNKWFTIDQDKILIDGIHVKNTYNKE
jgi:hypothetical protein